MSSTSTPSEIVEILRSKGLRITPQRLAVYANLLERCDHPTVDQILADLNQGLPISSKATVYSTLSSLREAGLVREVLLEEGITRYDANVNQHHHFRCECCGAIVDVAWEAMRSPLSDRLPKGYSMSTYELAIYGICPSCQQQN